MTFVIDSMASVIFVFNRGKLHITAKRSTTPFEKSSQFRIDCRTAQHLVIQSTASSVLTLLAMSLVRIMSFSSKYDTSCRCFSLPKDTLYLVT